MGDPPYGDDFVPEMTLEMTLEVAIDRAAKAMNDFGASLGQTFVGALARVRSDAETQQPVRSCRRAIALDGLPKGKI